MITTPKKIQYKLTFKPLEENRIFVQTRSLRVSAMYAWFVMVFENRFKRSLLDAWDCDGDVSLGIHEDLVESNRRWTSCWGCRQGARTVKRTGPSKNVWCNRLGSTKTSRFHLLTLELRFLKKLLATPNQQLFWCIFVLMQWQKVNFSELKTGLHISRCKWVRSSRASCTHKLWLIKFIEEREERKISKLIENWLFRRLTLLGKITIIKSLIASQLGYILSPLPTPCACLKETNSLLYKFSWNGKRDKNKRTHIIYDYTKGGLKMMLDIQSFNNAVKAKWVQRYLHPNNKGKRKLFTNCFLGNHHATALFLGNLKPEDVATLAIEDPFTKELVEAWCRLNLICNPISFSSMSIWYNSSIRINGNPFFTKAGLWQV